MKRKQAYRNRPINNLVSIGDSSSITTIRKNTLQSKYDTQVRQIIDQCKNQHLVSLSSSINHPSELINRRRSLSGKKQQTSNKDDSLLLDLRTELLKAERQIKHLQKYSLLLKQQKQDKEIELADFRKLLVNPGLGPQQLKSQTIKGYSSKNQQLLDRLNQATFRHQKEYTAFKTQNQFLTKELQIYKAQLLANPHQENSNQLIFSLRQHIRVLELQNFKLRGHFASVLKQEQTRLPPSLVQVLSTIDYSGTKKQQSSGVKALQKLTLKKNQEIMSIKKEKEQLKRIMTDAVSVLDKQLKYQKQSKIQDIGPLLQRIFKAKIEQEKALKAKIEQTIQKTENQVSELKEKQNKQREVSAGLSRQLQMQRKKYQQLQKMLLIEQQKVKQLQKSYTQKQKQFSVEKNQILGAMKSLSQRSQELMDQIEREGNRHKLQHLKLMQQNRSLMGVLSEKERQLSEKNTVIETFQQYKKKLNSIQINYQKAVLPKTQPISQFRPSNKIHAISSFLQWITEWNRIRHWTNRNSLILKLSQSSQLRISSLRDKNRLVSVLHQAFFQSKLSQVVQTTVIALSAYQTTEILELDLDYERIKPLIVRCLRDPKENQQRQAHRRLNLGAISLLSAMEQRDMGWSTAMSNQMLGVNGMKLLTRVLAEEGDQQLQQRALVILIMISKKRELLALFESFGIYSICTRIIKQNSPHIQLSLQLLLILLTYPEFLRTVRSFQDISNLHDLFLHPSNQVVQLALGLSSNLLSVYLYSKQIDNRKAIQRCQKLILSNTHHELLQQGFDVLTKLIDNCYSNQKDTILHELLQRMLKQIKLTKSSLTTLKVLKICVTVGEHGKGDQLGKDLRQIVGTMFKFNRFSQEDLKVKQKSIQVYRIIKERFQHSESLSFDQEFIEDIVQNYLHSKDPYEILAFLQIILQLFDKNYQLQALLNGQDRLIHKLIEDACSIDFKIAMLGVRVLSGISEVKESQSYFNSEFIERIVRILKKDSFNQDYRLCLSKTILNLSTKLQFADILERLAFSTYVLDAFKNALSDSMGFLFLRILQTLFVNLPKRPVLEPLLVDLNYLNAICQFSIKAKNHVEAGLRTLFIWDFLNIPNNRRKLAGKIVRERGDKQGLWMIEELMQTRNSLTNFCESGVFKMERLLHEMAQQSQEIRKQYQQYEED